MTDNELLLALSNMMDKKLEPIHGRLDSMEGRLDRMEVRLDSMEGRLDRVEVRLDGVEVRLDKMEGRLDKMEGRLDKLESEVSALHVGQLEMKKDIKQMDKKVSDTYQLALEAWGQSTENRVWLSNKVTV